MHATELLEQFRTKETDVIRCVLVNTEGSDGKPVVYERKGDVYLAGLGDGIAKLYELMELRRRRSTFWYRFLYGQYACLELDISIKRLQTTLNNVSVTWTE